MVEYPLLHAFRPEASFAWRGGEPITVETFLNDVAALAAVLPERGYVVNLCRDRYRFAVGFAAALCRRQVNLLPPHDAANMLDQLAVDYPDLYCLADTPAPAASRLVALSGRAGSWLRQPGDSDFCSRSAGGGAVHLGFHGAAPAAWQELGRSGHQYAGSGAAARLCFAAWGSHCIGSHFMGLRCLVPVPHQHSYGLESLLMLALQHGLVLHAGRPFYPDDIIAELAAACRPRLLVTTPVHLRIMLAEPRDLPPVDVLLSATAPLSVELARTAEIRFGAALFEIYGCSEAGQIAVRRTALTEEWRCLDGIVLRQDAAGTWASGVPIAEETLLSDAIVLRDAERFLLRGRIADLVNIAGKRASLANLNHHLNAIDGVLDGVFVAPDDDDGDAVHRLIAFAVAPGLDADAIMAALRCRIDAAFLPRPLHLVAALPRNTLGKLPREEVMRLLAESRGAIGRVT